MNAIDTPVTSQDRARAKRHRKLAFEPMSDAIFESFSTFLKAEIGIALPDAKKLMLQARLQKRLREVGLPTFEQYYDYVFSPAGLENELPRMIDAVTTNKTEFFREADHFEFLTQEALPRILRRKGRFKPVTLWSAGCSSGEEPYTLAMTLNELKEQSGGELHFAIMATDISEHMLEQAKLGVYPQERIAAVPKNLRTKYFLKSKATHPAMVRIVPELRALVAFRWLNLMEQNFGIREGLDIIFCRNVLIYFERATQEMVLDRICRHLKPGGYLFSGHSETLTGFSLPLQSVAHAIHRKIVQTYEEAELPLKHLNPGEVVVTEKPAVVRTVLGSCIAVTMFNHRLRVAAICHALLPHCKEQDREAEPEQERWKYVDAVIPEMVRRMRQYGVELKEIEVKVFGGADVLSARIGESANPTVGRANIAMAFRIIEAEQLQLKVSDVGGPRGRKIFFYTHNGEVLVKRLAKSERVP